MKEVTQSYLTRLWSRDEFKKEKKPEAVSFVHLLSRYFTYIVFAIAGIAALYWAFHDSDKIWNVVTAVLIVACPCALLLSNTFTNGNILRILAKHQFYLRGAQTIEDTARITHIVFDKTGTLTTTGEPQIEYAGHPLTHVQRKEIASMAAQSNHPLSRQLARHFEKTGRLPVSEFREIPGKGIEGMVGDDWVALGSQSFITDHTTTETDGSHVFVAIDGKVLGYFTFHNRYRTAIPSLVRSFMGRYKLSVLSGDHAAERVPLQHLMGHDTALFFNQQPSDKLEYIKALQQKGERVMMIGDGLNDAGALKQSNVGIALAENCNNFTPASDVIMDAKQLHRLPQLIQLCKANKQIVMGSFIVSIIYNIIGITLAVQGVLSPLVAAILMPASSLSILLITFGCSNLAAKWAKY